MGMGFAPTWLRQVIPLLHKTTLTTEVTARESALYRSWCGRSRENPCTRGCSALLLSILNTVSNLSLLPLAVGCIANSRCYYANLYLARKHNVTFKIKL